MIANEDLDIAWGRSTTDAGTGVVFRITCQTATPALTMLSSTSGPAAGGGTLTITGTNLGATTSVSFGATPRNDCGAAEQHLDHGQHSGGQRTAERHRDGLQRNERRAHIYLRRSSPVPTLSEWAMILFGLVLAGSAALFIQRRRQIV